MNLFGGSELPIRERHPLGRRVKRESLEDPVSVCGNIFSERHELLTHFTPPKKSFTGENITAFV